MADEKKKQLSSELKENEVTPITSWHCDTYCRKVRHVNCEGENGRDPNSPNRCPYLDEMLY